MMVRADKPSGLPGEPDMSHVLESFRLDFASRFSQAITHCQMNQTEFARQVGVSAGFVSDVVRGNKRPGAEFLFAVRKRFGISIDWLLTGEGTLTGGKEIDFDLLGAIRLQIAVVRRAILDDNQPAKRLLLMIRDNRVQEAAADPDIAQFLEGITPLDPDSALALELYNRHAGTQDKTSQHRNLLAAAIAHFEASKPIDKLAALSRSSGFNHCS